MRHHQRRGSGDRTEITAAGTQQALDAAEPDADQMHRPELRVHSIAAPQIALVFEASDASGPVINAAKAPASAAPGGENSIIRSDQNTVSGKPTSGTYRTRLNNVSRSTCVAALAMIVTAYFWLPVFQLRSYFNVAHAGPELSSDARRVLSGRREWRGIILVHGKPCRS
jgi:hypothetical protein